MTIPTNQLKAGRRGQHLATAIGDGQYSKSAVDKHKNVTFQIFFKLLENKKLRTY